MEKLASGMYWRRFIRCPIFSGADMGREFQITGKNLRQSALGLSLLFALVAPAEAQTAGNPSPPSITGAVSVDPAHDAAPLRMVRGLNFYPAFKYVTQGALRFATEDGSLAYRAAQERQECARVKLQDASLKRKI